MFVIIFVIYREMKNVTENTIPLQEKQQETKDRRVYVFRYMLESCDWVFIALEKTCIKENGNTCMIKTQTWETDKGKFSFCNFGYSRDEASKKIKEASERTMIESAFGMKGPDIYYVINEDIEPVCCVWKPDTVKGEIEISYQDKHEMVKETEGLDFIIGRIENIMSIKIKEQIIHENLSHILI